MAGRNAIAAKALGVTLSGLAVGVFIWDYIAVHHRGPWLFYQVETPHGNGGAVVTVGGPDTAGFANGNEGHTWEIRPISIGESQAVIDFRVKHFNYPAPSADMRAQLAESEFHRFILHGKQPLMLEAPDGATLSLSGTIQ